MKISLEQLSRIAKRFLRTLDKAEIHNMVDLEDEVGRRHFSSADNREFVEISVRPSNHNTSTFTISYIIDGTGIPIEAKINPTIGYTKMIVKAESEVLGYSPFFEDVFGNLQQMKDLHPADIKVVRDELASL